MSDLAGMFVRVSTYVADLESMPADLAISQMKMGLLRGVSDLDGGWASRPSGSPSSSGTCSASPARSSRPRSARAPAPASAELLVQLMESVLAGDEEWVLSLLHPDVTSLWVLLNPDKTSGLADPPHLV